MTGWATRWNRPQLTRASTPASAEANDPPVCSFASSALTLRPAQFTSGLTPRPQGSPPSLLIGLGRATSPRYS